MKNHISIYFLPQYQRQKNVFFFQSASWKRHCVTQWREQRGRDSYLPRQISQSDCEISSSCGKNIRLVLKCVVKWHMAKMYSTQPLQVLFFSDHISLSGPSRIRRLCIYLIYIYRKHVWHYTLITILGMLAELICDFCKIVHCSLVQCEVRSIPVL